MSKSISSISIEETLDGSKAILKQFGGYAWYVYCKNPDCEIKPNINSFDVPEDAVKEWNRRACA